MATVSAILKTGQSIEFRKRADSSSNGVLKAKISLFSAYLKVFPDFQN